MNNHKFIIRLKLNHVVFKLITETSFMTTTLNLETYYLQYLRLHTNHVFLTSITQIHGYYK